MISEKLVNISRKSVDLGEVSSMWKQANVVIIFKTGDRELMSSYRPVNLTLIVSELLVC